MKNDRFLIGILVGILTLVLVALAVYFLKPNSQEYGSDATAEGVVRNYILALQKGEYQKAFSYLDSTEAGIDLEKYQRDILMRRPEFSQVSVQMGNSEQTGEKALVSLTLLHASSGPFGDTWRENSSAILIQNPAGEWKILTMPYPFYNAIWNEKPVNP